MLVETESKKEYIKLIKEVLTRMKTNDLYIKSLPEKYKWKVGFIGVVMGLDGIKIKKEKIKAVLD